MFIVSVVSGCASSSLDLSSDEAREPTTKELEFDKGGRLIPGGRVAYEILPGIETRRRGSLIDLTAGKIPFEGVRADSEKVDRVAFTVNVAGGFSVADGRSNVRVPARRNFQLGAEIPGPAVVNTQSEHYRGSITARPGGRFFDVISLAADFEAGAQLNMTPSAGIYGGLRRFSYSRNSFRGAGSDVDLDFTGSTIGASLAF